MPTTLTDEQVASLREFAAEAQRNKGIADLANGIYSDPAYGQEMRKLIKQKYPNLPIPDYDTKAEVFQRLDKEKAEREAEAKADADRRADEKYKRQRKDTQDKYGFTDDGMKEVEKLMVDRNIGDYEVAASYVASQRPEPSDDDHSFGRHFWNHSQQDQFKEIADDPEAWARKEIAQAVRADMRATGRR
jgi:hypothetical protein